MYLNKSDLSDEEEKIFDRFCTIFKPEESLEIRENCIEQIGYLKKVVKHIDNQINGFDGGNGVLESVQDQYSKDPGAILLDEIDDIQKTINSVLSEI